MRSEHKIRLALIDDHGLFREGLSRLLQAEQDFELVGDFSSAADAIAGLDHLNADVVLLDFDLGEQTGIEVLRAARNKNLRAQVLVVTAGLSSPDTLRVLELGASGIFLKHRSPSDLIVAIRRTVLGEASLDAASVHTLVAAATAPARQKNRTVILSPREKEVLRAVFEGLTNKEIGARLDISETYVKAVMQQLFSKTGVRSRSQLVRVALERQVLGAATPAP